MEPNKEQMEAFIKEYETLVQKHEMDFISIPMYQPDESGGWKLVLQTQPISTKKKEDFIAKE